MKLFTTLLLTALFLPTYTFPTSFQPRAVSNSSKAGLTSPSSKAVEAFTQTGKVSWYYTWSPTPNLSSKNSKGLEFVPMLWGQRQVDEFKNTINQTIADLSVTSVLGMNEPQQEGQSNLTPQQGVDMWLTYIQPLKSLGVRLGSPAPSSAPSGKTWIQEFLRLCNGACSVDFIALHYYDVNATDFQEYMTDFYNTFQRPIWVTEWACQNFNKEHEQCSEADTMLFLNSTQTWLDSTPWIERYSFFGAGFDNLQGVNQDNQLIDSDEQLTDLGLQYIGQKNASTNGTGSADGPPSGGDGTKFGDEPGEGDKSNRALSLTSVPSLLTVGGIIVGVSLMV